jgi:hypothetical protein
MDRAGACGAPVPPAARRKCVLGIKCTPPSTLRPFAHRRGRQVAGVAQPGANVALCHRVRTVHLRADTASATRRPRVHAASAFARVTAHGGKRRAASKPGPAPARPAVRDHIRRRVPHGAARRRSQGPVRTPAAFLGRPRGKKASVPPPPGGRALLGHSPGTAAPRRRGSTSSPPRRDISRTASRWRETSSSPPLPRQQMRGARPRTRGQRQARPPPQPPEAARGRTLRSPQSAQHQARREEHGGASFCQVQAAPPAAWEAAKKRER